MLLIVFTKLIGVSFKNFLSNTAIQQLAGETCWCAFITEHKNEETKRQSCILFSPHFEAWEMQLCGRVNASKPVVPCKPVTNTVKWCPRCTNFTLVADFGGHSRFAARSRSPPSGSCSFVSSKFIRTSFVSLRLRLGSDIFVFWWNNMSELQQLSRPDQFTHTLIEFCGQTNVDMCRQCHTVTHRAALKEVSVHPNLIYFHIKIFVS